MCSCVQNVFNVFNVFCVQCVQFNKSVQSSFSHSIIRRGSEEVSIKVRRKCLELGAWRSDFPFSTFSMIFFDFHVFHSLIFLDFLISG